MAMSAEVPDLGPFAREQGPGSPAARAAAIAGLATVALALVRPLLDAAGAGADVRWTGRSALVLSAAGVLTALVGLYQVSARGGRGRAQALFGLVLAAAGGATAFFYAAVRDGTLQPGRFFTVYFDRDVLRAIPADLGRGAVNTLKLAFVSEGLAIVVGLVVATLALSRRWWLHLPAVAYVDVVRGLPLLMLTFLINFGLPFVGITLFFFASAVTTLTINASAYIAEIFRAGIQSLSRGQMDAARSLGMPHGTAMLFVIIPQAVRVVIPPLMNEFIALVKDTAIVSVAIGFTVAQRDLFGAAQQAAASTFSPTPYMAASLVYLAITVPLTRLVGRVERRLRVGLA